MNAIALPGLPPSVDILDPVVDAIRRGLRLLATAFTNAGAAVYVARVRQLGTAPKYIGWGIGTTAAAVGQTALVTESAPTTSGGRTTGTEAAYTTTVTDDTHRVTGSVTAAGSLAITEAATFDAATAGNMAVRGVFAALNVAAADAIAFDFRVQLLAGVV